VAFLVKRRTRYEIYADLLDIVARRGSCRLTRASYGANLPVDRAKTSLKFLASRGFVKENIVDDSTTYRITKRGLEYLETFQQMQKLFAALDEKIMPEVKPTQKQMEPSRTRVQIKLGIDAREVKISEDMNWRIAIQNSGELPIALTKVEDLFPASYELIQKPDYSHFEGTYLNLNERQVDPHSMEEIRVALKSYSKGEFVLRPRVLYLDENEEELVCVPDPVGIKIIEADRPDRVSTGFKDLDDLLLGGLPQNYAVLLTSLSCDERDLLVKKFLERGVSDDQTTFHITIEASGVKTLVEDFQSNFFLFLCNPQADKIIGNLSNVFKLKGVENLTDINIALTSAFRKLDKTATRARRICIDIVSDVLLQHHSVNTRRWLSGLIPELRSRGFTTLAVVNPKMHPPQEVQAILDLFEGEINIWEGKTKKGSKRYLRIKKMYSQRYLESEMPLEKERLQGEG